MNLLSSQILKDHHFNHNNNRPPSGSGGGHHGHHHRNSVNFLNNAAPFLIHNNNKNNSHSSQLNYRYSLHRATSASTDQAQVKKQKLPLWIEWNENDLNAEKWEGLGKVKDAGKSKPTSAPVNLILKFTFKIKLSFQFFDLILLGLAWF
jgi:hypothetical protein